MLGLRYHHLLLPASSQSRSTYDAPVLTYTADLIPIAALHISERDLPDAYFPNGSRSSTALHTNGLGVYPLGLRLRFRHRHRLQPFIAGQTGLLYFFDHVPDDRGRSLNFAAALGGGLSVTLSERAAFTVEYRYHHLSNGFRGSINPGLDAHMLSVGIGTGLY